MSTNQAPEPLRAALNLDDQMRELAAGLKDVIRETSDSYLKESPEDAYVDLACRLILRLRATLTVVPTTQAAIARIRTDQADAAFRTLDIFTRWLREHPECFYSTEIGASGKVELTFKAHGATQAFFQGESIQDAYAQAAQVINFNGGSL